MGRGMHPHRTLAALACLPLRGEYSRPAGRCRALNLPRQSSRSIGNFRPTAVRALTLGDAPLSFHIAGRLCVHLRRETAL